MSKRLKLHAAGACLLLLSACASAQKAPPPPTHAAAPVATSSENGDVTVYSLDNGQPLPATPPSPPAPPAQSQSPSIKHKMFSWFHGSDNDTVTVPPAQPPQSAPAVSTPAPAADDSDAGPPPDSKADAQPLVPAPETKTDDASKQPDADTDTGPVAPSDENAGHVSSPPPADSDAPQPNRMLTGKSSAVMPPKEEKTEDVAAAPSAAGDPVRVYFRHNDARLGPEGQALIAKVAAAQNDNHLPIQVEGHASTQARTNDPVHRAIVNLKVAMDRALSVTNALIRAGVPASAIQTIAFGDTRPSLAVDGKSEEAASRRVEIYTVGSQATDVVAAF